MGNCYKLYWCDKLFAVFATETACENLAGLLDMTEGNYKIELAYIPDIGF